MTKEMAPSEKIQQLEQRHLQLIEELDALNNRLEQALNGFTQASQLLAESEKAQAETVR